MNLANNLHLITVERKIDQFKEARENWHKRQHEFIEYFKTEDYRYMEMVKRAREGSFQMAGVFSDIEMKFLKEEGFEFSMEKLIGEDFVPSGPGHVYVYSAIISWRSAEDV